MSPQVEPAGADVGRAAQSTPVWQSRTSTPITTSPALRSAATAPHELVSRTLSYPPADERLHRQLQFAQVVSLVAVDPAFEEDDRA